MHPDLSQISRMLLDGVPGLEGSLVASRWEGQTEEDFKVQVQRRPPLPGYSVHWQYTDASQETHHHRKDSVTGGMLDELVPMMAEHAAEAMPMRFVNRTPKVNENGVTEEEAPDPMLSNRAALMDTDDPLLYGDEPVHFDTKTPRTVSEMASAIRALKPADDKEDLDASPPFDDEAADG